MIRIVDTLFVLLVLAGLYFYVPVSAQTSWTWETCYTNQCIKTKLNSLSPEKAADAKLTTWEGKTYVWYRQ